MKKVFYLIFAILVLFLGMNFIQAKDPDVVTSVSTTSISTSEATGTSYDKVTCGELTLPAIGPKIVSTIVTIIQIAVPVVLIIFGSLDLMKAVTAGKEDEIKKSQQLFLKRLMTGAIVFLLFAIVKFIVGIVVPISANGSMWNCVNCFISGICS